MTKYKFVQTIAAVILAISILSGCTSEEKVVSLFDKCNTVEQFENERNSVKDVLQQYLWGEMPEIQCNFEASSTTQRSVYDGDAICLETRLSFGKGLSETIRIVYPNDAEKLPIILKLDYLSDIQYAMGIEKQQTTNGKYVFVTVGRKDVAPDQADNRDIYGLTQYSQNDIGAVALWAYGAIAALNYLQQYSFCDTTRVAITGHSRDGKAAICAAAMDERFKVCVPNCSGTCGSASFNIKNKHSESAEDVAENFPHWFSSKFNEFATNNKAFPFDMIDAFGLIAPRAVLRIEAEEDLWANPKGSFATYRKAKDFYKLLGQPAEHNGYFLKNGEHGFDETSEKALSEFCNMYFYGENPSLDFYPDKITL